MSPAGADAPSLDGGHAERLAAIAEATGAFSDAHTTGDQTEWGAPPPDQVIAHTNLYWKYQTAPGRKAGTVETKNVDFAGKS